MFQSKNCNYTHWFGDGDIVGMEYNVFAFLSVQWLVMFPIILIFHWIMGFGWYIIKDRKRNCSLIVAL